VAGGCDPGISNIHGVTPLHVAVKQGDVMDVVEALVTSGCDTLPRNEAGHSPLYAAAVKGYVPVVEYLLTVINTPPSEDLLSAAALAPSGVQSELMAVLNSLQVVARSESPDAFELRPAKRTRYS
ncbi:hypothetical protein OG21DRAFT_1420719, partial [Imleria badia]